MGSRRGAALLLLLLGLAAAGCAASQPEQPPLPTRAEAAALAPASPVSLPTPTPRQAATPTRAATAAPPATMAPTPTDTASPPPPPTRTPYLPPATAAWSPTPPPTMEQLPATVALTQPTPPLPFRPTGVAIGRSVQGRPIAVYTFPGGPRTLIVVGGIHGGYEWNSVTLAYALLDYYSQETGLIPPEVTLQIIPVANPDGLFLATGSAGRFDPADVIADPFPGRFNANQVDLNRNWECRWSPTALWRDTEISGGSAPFSEPENVVLRDYFLAQLPALVIFLHSASDGVYAAGCPDTHPPSLEYAEAYGAASGYPVYPLFDAYPITGDAGDWLTTQGIPSITVELINHYQIDWERNRAGMNSIMRRLSHVDTRN